MNEMRSIYIYIEGRTGTFRGTVDRWHARAAYTSETAGTARTRSGRRTKNISKKITLERDEFMMRAHLHEPT